MVLNILGMILVMKLRNNVDAILVNCNAMQNKYYMSQQVNNIIKRLGIFYGFDYYYVLLAWSWAILFAIGITVYRVCT